MAERPILFSGEMVRAILSGRKTVTRRVVKSSINNVHPSGNPVQLLASWPLSGLKYFCHELSKATFAVQSDVDSYVTEHVCCPYGQPGDRLWVRESMKVDARGVWHYSADDAIIYCQEEGIAWAHHKTTEHCPSIHMPRWASRITLEVVSVKVERLHHIGEVDAKAEGISPKPVVSARTGESYLSYCEAFSDLWDKINGERGYSFESNPWVWAISFRRIE